MFKTARSFIHLDKILECDGRTDGRTDRIALASTAVCIASNAYIRAVKCWNGYFQCSIVSPNLR